MAAERLMSGFPDGGIRLEGRLNKATSEMCDARMETCRGLVG